MDPAQLSAFPLFADLDADSIATVARAATEVEVSQGDTIATEGDFGHALYLIESGTADVVHGGETVRTLVPGDVFGEIAIVSAGRRTATVVATSPMRLVALFKRDVWALEQHAPAALEQLRRLIAQRRLPRQ